jgi:tetratricopeptide (TPR) repeat protein
MTLKRIDLNTCVWGEWHLDVLRRVMLPTLLSPGNLPAIRRRFPLRYRIATTPSDREHIEEWPIFSRLAATVEIDWITENSSPDITYHIDWYRRSLSDAKAANAYCFMAYPDVAWSDGVLTHCADAISDGKVAVAIPYIRAISETLVPEIVGRAGDGPIALSGGELVRLGMRHMHPLSVAAMAGSQHALPSLEASWRVPDQGLLLREISRELSMVDPARLDANQYWNAVVTAHPESLHIAADSDDMLMLSLAPLFKDFHVYIPNHALQPVDLARVSRHPANDNPFVKYFAAHPIRLHYDGFDGNRWSQFERRADRFVGQALFIRELLSIWEAAHAAGCSLASKALSVGLLATPLANRWRYDGPVTVYFPSDEAFGEKGWETLEPLLRPERARELQSVILNHVVPGVRADTAADTWQQVAVGGALINGRSGSDGEVVNEARIMRRLGLASHRIYIIDRLIVPIIRTISPSTASPPHDLRPEAARSLPDADHASRAADFEKSAPDELSLGRSFHRLVRAVRATAITVTARFRADVFRRDVEIARQYPVFLRHFGVKLAGGKLEQQKRAAASALYQAGLYRHKLLFLYDLMKQFHELGGVVDPSPAFFEYCLSLVGDEQDLTQAEHYYRLALRLIPDFAEALYALGLLKRRAHMMSDASVLFKAAACAPPHANAATHSHIPANSWRNLAEIHRDIGKDETAEACFRKALHQFGIHGVYQAEIAKFLRARGRIADAAHQYELAMPYTHLYACEFTEPNYPLEERLPTGLDGKPCDPLTPTVVAEEDQGIRLLYWWHVYLPMPPHVPLDAASLLKLRPRARRERS